MATEHWLDTLGRGLASRLSRRETLKLAGSLALGALLGRADGAEARSKKPCLDGKTRCGRKCVDTATSEKHCGGCRQKCGKGETCTDGKCVGPSGAVTCGGSPCPDATFACKGGACICPDDREPCVGLSRPGRSGNVPMTCCPTDQVCTDGRCTCPKGVAECDGRCCPDATFVCKDKVCVCPSGEPPCVGPHRPGRAGNVPVTCCPEGQPCENGRCVRTCPTNQVQCGDACCCGQQFGGGSFGPVCTGTQKCCPGHFTVGACCQPEDECCFAPGPSSEFQGGCCPPGRRCCGKECCQVGQKCCKTPDPETSGVFTVCCPQASICCVDTCCSAGQSCQVGEDQFGNLRGTCT